MSMNADNAFQNKASAENDAAAIMSASAGQKSVAVYSDNFKTIPVGPLGIIALPGCRELAEKIDRYLVDWRKKRQNRLKPEIAFYGYMRDTYILKTKFDRFGSGEGKCTLMESVRGYDIFIICDCFNYNETYEANHDFNGEGKKIRLNYSPDEHYANLKRAIAAMGGKARRITVIMPMLYEGRQHKRTKRESLDSALILQELCNFMGVDDIITFDAHDPRVMNAIPLHGFENVYTTYQMIKALVNNLPDLKINKDSLAVISPDVGGVNRAVYYTSVLGVDLGMFYKRRDYSQVVHGKNPIKGEPEYLGPDLHGKDVILVDDMISSGGSILETSVALKKRGAENIYICCAFGLFCDGLDRFDEYYKDGIISKIFTTNLTYRSETLINRPWYCSVDLSKYTALIIDTLNHDMSLSPLLNHSERISKFFRERNIKIDIQRND